MKQESHFSTGNVSVFHSIIKTHYTFDNNLRLSPSTPQLFFPIVFSSYKFGVSSIMCVCVGTFIILWNTKLTATGPYMFGYRPSAFCHPRTETFRKLDTTRGIEVCFELRASSSPTYSFNTCLPHETM